MTIRDIAVLFDGSEGGAKVLEAAAVLTVAWEARLEGAATAGADEAPCASLLAATVRRNGLEAGPLTQGTRSAKLALARRSDLVVTGQADPHRGEFAIMKEEIEAIVLRAGRPVLILPYAGKFDLPAPRVMIGWNGSREATRAVHDALPMLARADSVNVFSVATDPSDDWDADLGAVDLAAHLAHHGVTVTLSRTVAAGLPQAAALLNEAADLGIGMLVTGAYGQTPMRERVLGGVTRSVLEGMTVPVLMSH
jgi:nucleotide-binding universal stress UspA family protein